MSTHPSILIVDLGSQLTLVIARVLRENGHRSVVLSPGKAGIWRKLNTPKAIILSGSDRSVYDENAPQPTENVINSGVPILGICYGMQWLAHHLGGVVENDHKHVEYGPAQIGILGQNDLFAGIDRVQRVWASHGDSVLSAPDGFDVIAVGENGEKSVRAVSDIKRKMWGVQFHPEVEQTLCGKQVLLNFICGICGCESDWEPADIVATIRSKIELDTTARAVLGFSGGVDSTTMAAILSPVMGHRLLGVCIDGGHLREGELEEIRRHAEATGISLRVHQIENIFLEELEGVVDAEVKRRVFKAIYLRVLSEVADEFNATHVVQGTLATDEIESGVTGGDLIKSHHNVGLDWKHLESLAPLSSFFKYEVRALANELGLPNSVMNREPFPGPGLFLRIFGQSVTRERLQIVRWADQQVRAVLANKYNGHEISQLVVALCCVNTTGVKGDSRAYGPAVVVRAVYTTDFMTASAIEFSPEIRREITSVLTRHNGVVRVWWDEVPKPPATTEFE